MGKLTIVCIFVFWFLTSVCIAQIPEPGVGDTSTELSTANRNLSTLRLVVIVCSAFITLLALAMQICDDKYKRPIWPWGLVGLFAILVLLFANYKIHTVEKDERIKEDHVRQRIEDRIKDAMKSLNETKRHLEDMQFSLNQGTAQLSGDIDAAKSGIDTTLGRLEEAQVFLVADYSERSKSLQEFLNVHVIKTLGALADTAHGVPFLVKKNNELIGNLTKFEGRLFSRIDAKNQKIDTVLANFGKFEAFTKKKMDTSNSEELVQEFFRCLQNPDQLSKFPNLLSQNFADYMDLGTIDTSKVSNIGGLIRVPYEDIQIKLTEILGGPGVLLARFSWPIMPDTYDHIQETQGGFHTTDRSTKIGEETFPQTETIEIRKPPRANGFMHFVIENEVIASISGTWNVSEL